MRGALEGVDDIDVVGEATAAGQLLPLVARTSPDVVLLDLEMPDLDVTATITRVRAEHPKLTLVVTSDSDDAGTVLRALQLGAIGYILKGIHPADLAGA